MSQLVIDSETENKLLSRREVACTFELGNGLLTRQAAAEAIAARLGLNAKNVQIVYLRGNSGVRRLRAQAYVFTSEDIAKKELPKYLFIRMLGKDERKKAREDLKKVKSTQPQASQKADTPKPAEAKA